MSKRNPVSDHLHAAMHAEEEGERCYHIREAAQLFRAKIGGVSDE